MTKQIDEAWLKEEIIWATSTTGEDFQCIDESAAREMLAEILRLRGAHEPPAEPMPFKDWASDLRTQSMQDTIHAYKAKISKLEYELACRPVEPTSGPCGQSLGNLDVCDLPAGHGGPHSCLTNDGRTRVHLNRQVEPRAVLGGIHAHLWSGVGPDAYCVGCLVRRGTGEL